MARIDAAIRVGNSILNLESGSGRLFAGAGRDVNLPQPRQGFE